MHRRRYRAWWHFRHHDGGTTGQQPGSATVGWPAAQTAWLFPRTSAESDQRSQQMEQFPPAPTQPAPTQPALTRPALTNPWTASPLGQRESLVSETPDQYDPPLAPLSAGATVIKGPAAINAPAVNDASGKGNASALANEATSEDGSTVPLADYQELLSRVDDLESSWDEYQEELDDEAAEKKKKSSWKLSGRVHLDNWNFTNTDPGTNFLDTGDPLDDPEDRWDFRRIRIELSGNVPNNMVFRTQIDFNNPSLPELKDAYLGFSNLPHNQLLLIGNQKRPIGLDHLNSSRYNMFIERPLAVETFNEDARRLGVCMYGYTDDEMFNWRYGAFPARKHRERRPRTWRLRPRGLVRPIGFVPLVRRGERRPWLLSLCDRRFSQSDRPRWHDRQRPKFQRCSFPNASGSSQ